MASNRRGSPELVEVIRVRVENVTLAEYNAGGCDGDDLREKNEALAALTELAERLRIAEGQRDFLLDLEPIATHRLRAEAAESLNAELVEALSELQSEGWLAAWSDDPRVESINAALAKVKEMAQ